MVKYTNALIDEIKVDLETMTPQEIATARSLNARSLIAKLSSMGLYKKQPYTTKVGAPSIRKSVLVDQIAELIGESAETIGTLEKCNKNVLELLIKHLT